MPTITAGRTSRLRSCRPSSDLASIDLEAMINCSYCFCATSEADEKIGNESCANPGTAMDLTRKDRRVGEGNDAPTTAATGLYGGGARGERRWARFMGEGRGPHAPEGRRLAAQEGGTG